MGRPAWEACRAHDLPAAGAPLFNKEIMRCCTSGMVGGCLQAGHGPCFAHNDCVVQPGQGPLWKAATASAFLGPSLLHGHSGSAHLPPFPSSYLSVLLESPGAPTEMAGPGSAHFLTQGGKKSILHTRTVIVLEAAKV